MNVIKVGRNLYLALSGSYVNNISDQNIRLFSKKQQAVAQLIAEQLKGEVIPYKPFKKRGLVIKRQRHYTFTRIELEHLLLIKKGNKYLSYDGAWNRNIKSKHVIKLPLEKLKLLWDSDDYIEIREDENIVITSLKNEKK